MICYQSMSYWWSVAMLIHVLKDILDPLPHLKLNTHPRRISLQISQQWVVPFLAALQDLDGYWLSRNVLEVFRQLLVVTLLFDIFPIELHNFFGQLIKSISEMAHHPSNCLVFQEQGVNGLMVTEWIEHNAAHKQESTDQKDLYLFIFVEETKS